MGLYFGWLAWALLAGAVLVGAASCVPSRVQVASRVLGVLTATAGVVLTCLSLGSDLGDPHSSSA